MVVEKSSRAENTRVIFSIDSMIFDEYDLDFCNKMFRMLISDAIKEMNG